MISVNRFANLGFGQYKTDADATREALRALLEARRAEMLAHADEYAADRVPMVDELALRREAERHLMVFMPNEAVPVLEAFQRLFALFPGLKILHSRHHIGPPEYAKHTLVDRVVISRPGEAEFPLLRGTSESTQTFWDRVLAAARRGGLQLVSAQAQNA